MRQASASTPEEIKELEDGIKTCQLVQHREEADRAHSYFVEVYKKCASDWKRITELEADENTDQVELSCLKRRFDLVLSVDYQMSKLLPYWGESPQPGSTYYLQKMSHDLFGIINHATNSSAVYIFDERLGPKNTDHTLSYMTHYLLKQAKLPSWVRRIHIFMDNQQKSLHNGMGC